MNAREFNRTLAQLGMTQSGASRFLGVAPSTVRRYAAGTLAIPTGLALLLTAMRAKGIKPNALRELAGLEPVPIDLPSGRPRKSE